MISSRDLVVDFSEKHLIYFILLFAFLLRFNGINFGLPYLYHNNDWLYVNSALRILQTGDLNPHHFYHPGSFLIYFLAFLYAVPMGIYFLWCLAQGYVHDLNDFFLFIRKNPLLFFDINPVFFHYAGRLVVLFFALVSIYLVYLIAKHLFNWQISLLAALCLTISPLHITHSRFVRIDVTAGMLILFSVYFLLKCLEQNHHKKMFIWSSLFAGFAIAAKYPSGLVIFPLLFYCSTVDRKHAELFSSKYFIDFFSLRAKVSQALLLVFVGFFVFAPYVILDYRTTLKYMNIVAAGGHLGHSRLPGLQNYLWYLRGALNSGIGGLFFEVFAGLGLFFTFREKSSSKYLFLGFPLLHFVVIGGAQLRWERWFIPILPFEAILFAVGFYYFFQYLVCLKDMKEYRAVFIALFTAMLIVAVYPTMKSNIEEGNKVSRTDTRTIAKEWVEQNLPEGSKIVYEHYAPHLNVMPKRKFKLVYTNWEWIAKRPLSFYQARGFDYIIIANLAKDRFYAEPDRYKKEVANYETLKKEAALVKKFDLKENPGPIIEIYRL